MGSDMLVRLEIPISVRRIVPTPAMIFSRWMPLTEDEFIVVREEDATLKLWFDESCLGHVSDVHDISRRWNLFVSKVFADVTLHDVPTELIEHIRLKVLGQLPESEHLQQEYARLGRKAYLLAITHLNRLISYVRSERGQYWLQEYPVDEDSGTYHSIEFKAKARIDSQWISWYPEEGLEQRIEINIGRSSLDESRFVYKDIWPEAKAFVTSTRRTSLVLELLAGAEWLVGIGHRRSALTEAVTALEVALSEFAKRPKAEFTFSPQMVDRMNVASLKSWVKHAGLSGTIYYLFPVIFSEDQMPTDLLQRCQEAVQERGNVVHNSQRDVSEDKISLYLCSIRDICRTLEACTEG